MSSIQDHNYSKPSPDSIQTCKHPDQYVIEDIHDGSIVCTSCALVLDQAYSFNHFLVDNTERFFPIDNMVTTICDNCNYDESIKSNAQIIYENACKKLQDFRRFTIEEVSSYAVYKSLKDNGVPISGKELLSISNVSLSRIWQIENVCEPNSYSNGNVELLHFIDRYSTYCRLSFAETQKLKSNAVEASIICMNHAPQNVAVGLIYMCSKKFSVQGVSKICNVSPSSIYKIVRLLNEQMK